MESLIQTETLKIDNNNTNSTTNPTQKSEDKVLEEKTQEKNNETIIKDEKATAEFFWKDSEGREWGCTGDIGYMDEDGFVWVEGRAYKQRWSFNCSYRKS